MNMSPSRGVMAKHGCRDSFAECLHWRRCGKDLLVGRRGDLVTRRVRACQVTVRAMQVSSFAKVSVCARKERE
jgi:hypothetical protein